MERDFLGLNWNNTPKVVKEDSVLKPNNNHSAAKVVRPHPYKAALLPSHQFPYYNKATSGDGDFFPSRFGSNTQPPSLPKESWTLPVNNVPQYNSVPASSKSRCFQGLPFARPLSNASPSSSSSSFDHLYSKPGQQASLTLFYSGIVHLFQDIPAENAELIMSIASGSKSYITADRTLDDRVTEKNYITNMQLPTQHASSKGGLAMARKATLDRFLEKRRHRLSHSRPYNLNAKFMGLDTSHNTSEMAVAPWQQQEMASPATV